MGGAVGGGVFVILIVVGVVVYFMKQKEIACFSKASMRLAAEDGF